MQYFALFFRQLPQALPNLPEQFFGLNRLDRGNRLRVLQLIGKRNRFASRLNLVKGEKSNRAQLIQ